MSHEILINVTPQETRVAMLEQGMLQEVLVERVNRMGLVGNIYKGKIARVMPGMEAAFVDIGMDKAAFLHVSDIFHVDAALVESEPEPPRRPIGELLHEGQELLVQVIKDPLGSKGARLTTQLTIPSRFLVLMPNNRSIGVSTKIEDESEKQRLRDMVAEVIAGGENAGAGFIVRTVAEGAGEQALRRDATFLARLWAGIEARARQTGPAELVHNDLPLSLRTLRDFVDGQINRILVDSPVEYQRIRRFAEQYVPDVAERIELHDVERPIFDLHGVEDEIQKALQRKVQLKSGGYLMIDQTEAMTTIDVNTGGFIGHRNLEETIYKTNLEATQAIARQLRLRNLGGIIIVDFIDMIDEEHKRQVMRALNKALDKDYARTHVSEVSELGLVEMTRKRTRESLEHVLCATCPTCEGRGSVRTAETVCYEIFREILRVTRLYDARELTVLAAREVIDLLLDEESGGLADLQSTTRATIRLQVESLYTQEQYDVVIT